MYLKKLWYALRLLGLRLQLLAGQLEAGGRPFDFDSMLDLIMLCHYETRVSKTE